MSDPVPETSLALPFGAAAIVQALLKTSLDGVIIFAPARPIVAANEVAARMFGYSVERLCHLRCETLFESPDQELAGALAAGDRTGTFRGEIRLVRRGGEKFSAEISVAAVSEENGVRHSLLLIRDHADRERMMADLRSSALRYRAITATTTDGCWEVDDRGRILEANGRCAMMYGYSHEELLERSVKDFEATRNPTETAQHIRDIMDFGYARFETRHRCKDGLVLDVEVSTSYQSDSGRFIAFLRDITARKRAEVALRETEERYRGLVESAFNGIVVHQDGIILTANAAYAATFGYTVEELTGRPVLDVVAPESRAAVAEIITAGSENCYVTTGVRKDGACIPIEISGKACFIEGRVARIAALRDLTDRMRAERERERLQAELYHAQKMESVGRLAGGVAHDFNNMLTAIQCNVSLALDELSGASSLRDNLGEILKCTQRSANLTRQLLAFARKQTIDPRVVDLNVIVAGTLKMLQRIIGEDIELVWRPTAGLWYVKIDPSQVDQMLANLCVNARDAIRSVGTITLELANLMVSAADCAVGSEAVAGEYVLLAVTDTGCGMTAEVMSHLFEPFFTTKELGRGTGLGLATTYGIVKQNGGFVDVQSVEGSGTTLKFYLPRHAGSAPVSVAEEDDAPLGRGHETILFVEDEAAILRVGKMVLENLGYKVLTAAKPSDALRLAEEHNGKFDLLITDVVMPEMNGQELTQRLLAQHPDLRVVFISGYTANFIAPHGVLEPGVHFVQKPFTRKVLADMVRAALG